MSSEAPPGKPIVSQAEKLAKDRERRRERDRKIARGSAKITTLMRDGRLTDRMDDFGKRRMKALVRSEPDQPARKSEEVPPKRRQVRQRVRIGCCNDTMCMATKHNHDQDWTFLGSQFFGRREVKKDVVPDPYTLHSFPRTRAVIRRHVRDDFALMHSTTSSNNNVVAILLQLARVYEAERVNLFHTREQQRREHQLRFDPMIFEARAKAGENPELARETTEAEQMARMKFTVLAPVVRRQLDALIRVRVQEALEVTRTAPAPGVPRIAVVEAVLGVIGQYRQDCDEQAMHQALVMALSGKFGREFDACVARIGGIRSVHAPPPEPARAPEAPKPVTVAPRRPVFSSMRREDPPSVAWRYRLVFPCQSQWQIAGGKPACASIAVSACDQFLRAAELAKRTCTSVDNLLGIDVDWGAIVRNGVHWYSKWVQQHNKPKGYYMLVKEAVEGDVTRHARLAKDYEFDELFGSLRAPPDVDPEFNIPHSFSEFLACLRETECFRADRAFACAFSSNHVTFSFARLSGGVWWIFDSHGTDKIGRSTLARFLREDELIAYVRSLFGLDADADQRKSLDQERADMDETTLNTICSFSAFMMYRKPMAV